MFGLTKKNQPVEDIKEEDLQEGERIAKFGHESKLKPCEVDSEFFQDLWDILHTHGGFIWVASVGEEKEDMLGEKGKKNRPARPLSTWSEMEEALRTEGWVDSMSLVAEVEGKGTVTLLFRNYIPATGYLVVAGDDEEWVDETFDELLDLFYDYEQQGKGKWLYNKAGFAVMQSVIPLCVTAAFMVLLNMILLTLFPVLLGFFWYLTTASLLATFYLGGKVSDKLLRYAMLKYPYLKYIE